MRHFLFIILAFVSTISLAQDTTATAKIDTTEISLKKSKILIITNEDNQEKEEKKPESTTKRKIQNTQAMWSGLQIGVNGLFADDGGPLQSQYNFLDLDYSRNRSIALNLISKRFDLGVPYVGFSTGLGIGFNRYALNRNVRLQYDADHVWAEEDTIHNFSKNFIKTTHITLPVFLELNTHKRANNGFRLAAGFEVAYLLSAKTKIKYKYEGKKQVDKTKGNFNMAPFRLSPMVMLGYRDISFYAKAALSPFFIDGKGPADVYHASFGLLFSFD